MSRLFTMNKSLKPPKFSCLFHSPKMHMFAIFGPLRTEMNIFLPFDMLKLVPFHVRKGKKMNPFFAQPTRIRHYWEHPLGPPSGWTTVRLQNRKLGPICTQKLLFKQIFCHHQLLTNADGFSRFFKFCLRTDNLQRLRAEICLKKTGKNRLNKQKSVFLGNHLLLSHYSFH